MPRREFSKAIKVADALTAAEARIAELERERDHWHEQVKLVLNPDYLAKKIEQAGLVDAEWKARAALPKG
jgi:hypothetical protein